MPSHSCRRHGRTHINEGTGDNYILATSIANADVDAVDDEADAADEVNAVDASKMSLALAEWPMSQPSSADTIKIGRVWKGIIMGQVYSAKNKAKTPRHVSIPLLNRISKYSTDGWKKASCLEAYEKLKPPPGAAE